MQPILPRILTVNGGSSSIKFALFEAGAKLSRLAEGAIERIGLSNTVLRAQSYHPTDNYSRPLSSSNYQAAVDALVEWVAEYGEHEALSAVGHRVVHGGRNYSEPQRVSAAMIAELQRLCSFDPAHLPEEILLLEAFRHRFPNLPQVACFDTAFYHNLPRVAQILPIPRRYEAQGVRRYGFHGLSYEFLMKELARQAGTGAAQGRIVLAHLGNGASLAAVRDGKPMDTSMSFTPASGVPMSTRSGDLDPSLAWYLARTEGLDVEGFNTMVNSQSGMLGVSETSSDMRDLLECEAQDIRAAEAVALFCYQVRKWIGAFAAALGGLNTLVFSGGIGEGAPAIRTRICAELGFLGVELNETQNAMSAPLISSESGSVAVRVIGTDEELVIAESVAHVLNLC